MTRLLLLGFVSGCSFGEDGKEPDAGPSPGPTEEPGIVLDSPAEGTGSYGSISAAWTVQGVTLDPAGIGAEDEDGAGHVHVYVDDQLVEETAETSTVLDGLLPGEHTILVRLATNSHEELSVDDSVGVRVIAPSVSISSPADGAVLAASSTPLVFSVDDFTISPAMGGADVFGEGYFRVLVDDEPRDWGTDPLLAVATGLTEGRHTIGVELVSNSGLPLDPPAVAEIEVEVPVGTRGVYWDRSAFTSAYESATVPVSLTTTAFTLFDRDLARPPVDGEGHLHLFLDGAWLDATAEPARVLHHLAPGDHVIEARLVSNDGFELPIVDRMHFNLAADRPDALVTFPGNDWGVAPAFDLTFETENFTLDPAAMGGVNAPHEGHAQVYLDGLLHSETGETTVPFTGLLPGNHGIRIELVNNDGTVLAPPVYTELNVVVE